MKYRGYLLGRCVSFSFVLVLVAALGGCVKKPQSEIETSFQRFRTGLLEGDADAAWSVVDSQTQGFFSDVLRDSLALDRRKVLNLDYVHKIYVLRLRVEFAKQELQNMTGHDVFVLAVTNAWIPSSSIQAIEKLQHVRHSGDYASAALPEQPDVPAIFFLKERNEWRVALWKGFEVTNAELLQTKLQNKLSEKDFLMTTLRHLSKYDVDDGILDGPLNSVAYAGVKDSSGAFINREAFSLSLPKGWLENRKAEMYEPNSYVLFEGPRSCFFYVVVASKSVGASVDALVNHQRKVMESTFKNATIANITKWAAFEGTGVTIEGGLQGVALSRVRLFGFENAEKVCLITECGDLADLKAFTADFDQIRHTFTLK